LRLTVARSEKLTAETGTQRRRKFAVGSLYQTTDHLLNV
jgi:hypothetical protein